MFHNITCSTKCLTLAIAQFLFISFGVLCEFAAMSDVFFLLSLQEEEVHSFYLEGTDVNIW